MQFHESTNDAAGLQNGSHAAVNFHNHEVVMGGTDIVETLRKNIPHDEHIAMRNAVEMHRNVAATEELIGVVGLSTLLLRYRKYLLHWTSSFS